MSVASTCINMNAFNMAGFKSHMTGGLKDETISRNFTFETILFRVPLLKQPQGKFNFYQFLIWGTLESPQEVHL